MIFPLLFQLQSSTPEQTRVQIPLQITRVALSSRQLEERQINFVRPNEILITIPLNQTQGTNQLCLNASIPRSRLNEIFNTTPEAQRTGAIYSWLINLQTSILANYSSQSSPPRTFTFNMATVPTTATVVQPAPPVSIAPVLNATPTRAENPTVHAPVLPLTPPVRIAPTTEPPRAPANQPQVRSPTVTPPTVLPFTQNDANTLRVVLTTPGRIDVPMSTELASDVVAGFLSLSSLPHFNEVWDQTTRNQISTRNTTRREIIGVIEQILAATNAPTQFVNDAHQIQLRLNTLTDQERIQIRTALTRAGFASQEVTSIDRLLFDISRNGSQFRQSFNLSSLAGSQTTILASIRGIITNSGLIPSDRTNYLSTFERISSENHQYNRASLSMYLSEPLASNNNRPLFTVNELYSLFHIIDSLHLNDDQILSIRASASGGRNGVFDRLVQLAGSNRNVVTQIRRLRELPREPVPQPSQNQEQSTQATPSPPTQRPISTTRSAAVTAMVAAVITEANPSTLIRTHNYSEADVSAAVLAIYQDLTSPTATGLMAQRFRTFIRNQPRAQTDDDRRRQLLQFYAAEHGTISRDLPALWSAFNHRPNYYPPGSGVVEFVAALSLINWRLNHPNISEYPAGRWDLQSPVTNVPPAELSDVESAPITRANLNTAEQQIYDNIVRGNVSSILSANLSSVRLDQILRAVIRDSTLNTTYGVSDESPLAVQREILSDTTIAADLPDLWVRSRLPVLTANGQANVQTLAALTLHRWRELHPATATREAPAVGQWDPNYQAPRTPTPRPQTPTSPVQQPIQQPAPQQGTAVSSTAALSQQQNDFLLDVIIGNNLSDRRPRFARLFENMSLLTSNPTLFAEQLYYFYANRVASNDQYRITRIGQISPTTDVLHRSRSYLLASNSTPEQANNLAGYRTVLLDALLETVRSECAPTEVRDGAPTRRRFGDPISGIATEVSALLRRAGYDPAFISTSATSQQSQDAPLEAIVLAISYIEWRVHNRNVSVPDFNALIQPVGANVGGVASGRTPAPTPTPAPQTTVQLPVALTDEDGIMATSLNGDTSQTPPRLGATQLRAEISRQLGLAQAAVAVSDQTDLSNAQSIANQLIGQIRGVNDGATDSLNNANSAFTTIPVRDRRPGSLAAQTINRIRDNRASISRLVNQAESDAAAIAALRINAAPQAPVESASARRVRLQLAYNTARDNLRTALESVEAGVTYCEQQLDAARRRNVSLADFNTARNNITTRSNIIRGSSPTNTEQQYTLSQVTERMSALSDALANLRNDSANVSALVREVNGFTRRINATSRGSLDIRLSSAVGAAGRLTPPREATTAPAPRPLSAAEQLQLRQQAALSNIPVVGPASRVTRTQDNMEHDAAEASRNAPAPTIHTTPATFGQARAVTNSDGSLIGSGSEQNPHVIDVPIRGITQPIFITRSIPLTPAVPPNGPVITFRIQLRPITADTPSTVNINALSRSIRSEISSRLRNSYPSADIQVISGVRDIPGASNQRMNYLNLSNDLTTIRNNNRTFAQYVTR